MGGRIVWGMTHKSTNGQVKTATVTRGEVKETISISGKVVADKQAVVNFQTAGKVAYVGVKAGDKVKAGQYLMSLDTGDLDTAARIAYNQYLSAEANAKKIEDDVKNHDTDENFATKNIRINAQTTRDIAYDNWQQSIKNVQKAVIYAPFEGYATAVTVSAAGDTAGVTDGVTIVAPGGLHFEGEVDETDVAKVTVGQPVEVTLDAFEGKTFAANISKIGFASRLSSTGANVYPVELTFQDPNAAQSLRLGMNGDANIILATAQNVLKLPIEAVADGYVYQNDEKQTKKKVVTGLEGENDIEIKEGVSEGEKVIIK